MRSILTPGLLLLGACNTAPGALQITLGPAEPHTTTDLVAELSGDFTDPDGDEVSYSFTWYQDEQARPDLTELTVPASETAKGQTWKIFVLPTDGRVDGPPSEAEILVLNTPPAVETVTLEPTVPLTTEDVVATVTVDDEDGDTVTLAYSWHLGDAETGYQDAILPASATTRGDVWTLHITPSDDEKSGDEVLASVNIDNTAPVITSVILDETEVYEADTIGMVVHTDDADGDGVSLEYTWHVDEELVLQGPQATLSGEHFDKHQQVTVTVTPNDGFVEGDPVSAGPVTVLNTAPGITGVEISPTEIYEATELDCLAQGWTDDDGDPEGYEVIWYVAGAALEIDESLDGTHFDRGDIVSCRVRPWDGEEYGEQHESSAFTVLNSAPVVSTATLSSTSPAEGDTLTVTVAHDDDDGDAVALDYAWYVDGSAVGTEDRLDSTLFDKHQSIHVEVTPNDGLEDGLTVSSSSATAMNTPPEVTSLLLSPTEPYTDATITTSVSTTDADGDAVSLAYTWIVDGGATSETGSSLDGLSWFDKHQQVTVRITPSDGEDDGSVYTSSVTVLNSPPSAPAVAIEPEQPLAGQDGLLCSLTAESTDDDGDEIGYAIAWAVDGAAFTDVADTVLTGDTVLAEHLNADERWTCSATPSDEDEAGTPGTASVVTGHLVDPRITCGGNTSCMLDVYGTVQCWGWDDEGQATAPSGTFQDLGFGSRFACAIDDNSEVQCWGWNDEGQAAAPSGQFIALGLGDYHSCGLDSSSGILCWGNNDFGQSSPPGGVFTALAGGAWHSCALDSGGLVQCWGLSSSGQTTPPSGEFTAISAGGWRTCGLDASGEIQCWGTGSYGEATPPSGLYSALDVGTYHSCALDSDGAIHCWGRDDHGQSSLPSGEFIAVSAGSSHTCALEASGAVQCWGRDDDGESTPP
jgi:hypothetical protein